MSHEHEPMGDDPNTCRYCGIVFKGKPDDRLPERMHDKDAAKFVDNVLLKRGYRSMREYVDAPW